MSDGAVTFLVSRLTVATLEFLIVGFLVAGLLKVFPNISPRWRRRIWFLALCKPFVTICTGFLNGIVPIAPAISGSLLGDLMFPGSGDTNVLVEGGKTIAFLQVIAYAWIVITSCLLLRVCFRAVKIRQVVDDHMTKGYLLKPTTLKRLDPTLVIPPSARIIITPEDDGPATMGVFQPAIVIPESLLPWIVHHRDPSPIERARFCQVLRHELAHVANRDDLLTLMTMIMLSFFWFHPVAHWAYRRVRMNNELCCDDDVVGSGVQPADYVDTLMSIVAGSFSRRGFSMHILGDSSPAGVLRKRLHHILGSGSNTGGKPIFAYVTVLIILATMPRFLGYGRLVEVLMKSGETRIMTRAEFAQVNPFTIDRVITPGVVDDSWYIDATVPSLDGATMLASGEAAIDAANGSFVTPEVPAVDDPAVTPLLPSTEDAVALANTKEDVGEDEVDAPVSTTPKRTKSRGPSWPSRVGTSDPSAPILPPPSDRR